jgi:hypothetical protein
VSQNTNGLNAAAGGLAAVVGFISVHDDVPDTAGSNEVAGGSYARQAVAWGAPAGGVIGNTGQLVHAMPAGSVAAFYGEWSAVSGGTFYGYIPRAGAGQSRSGFGSVDAAGVTANAIQSAAHGLTDDMTVVVYNVLSEALPTGLSEGTVYFVVGATTDTFQVSLTQAGAAVNITAQGELYFARFVAETFTSDGNLVTDVGDLTLSTVVI